MGVAILQWEARSYEPIESLTRRTISKEDTVYASYQAYYGAKKNASLVYLGSLSEKRSDGERVDYENIDKVIVDPDRARNGILSKLGGRWERISQIGEDAKREEFLGRKLAAPYRLATYVRSDSER